MSESDFIKRIPEIISVASKNPLSLLVFTILLVFILAIYFFASSSESIKLVIFLVLFSCAIILAVLVLKKYELISGGKEQSIKNIRNPWVYYLSRVVAWSILIFIVNKFTTSFGMTLYYELFVYINIAIFIPLLTLIVSLMTPIPARIALAITLLNNLSALLIPFLGYVDIMLKLGAKAEMDIKISPTPLLYVCGTAMLVNLALVAFTNSALVKKRVKK